MTSTSSSARDPETPETRESPEGPPRPGPPLRVLVAVRPHLVEQLFSRDAWARLQAVGEVERSPTPADHRSEEARRALRRADVLLTGWGTDLLDQGLLGGAPHLRAVVHTGGSVRPVVTQEVVASGVAVSSQAALNALPVAEYALATILLSLKDVFTAEHAYREVRGAVDVRGLLARRGTYRRRVGVVGASTVGRRLLALLAPFDLEVVLADPTLTPDDAGGLGAELVGLDELMATSDVVSLHAPLLASTHGMVDARRVALLRDGATLVNTARGALVDEAALVAELRTGRIRAVVDVTEPEVPEESSPLWDLPNVMLTPHVAGAQGNELRRLGDGAVEEVERLAAGLPLLRGVSAERYRELA